MIKEEQTSRCLARDWRVRGTVQGVGFRPFVHRTAKELGLGGWVKNDPHGVLIHAVGTLQRLDQFAAALLRERPAAARIDSLEMTAENVTEAGPEFTIMACGATEIQPTANITPDLAMCSDCQRELMDPADRRYQYPFINCTQCGPRYSILEQLPYDRPHTTMADFALCPECATEYDSIGHRRHHAQPNACPVCGPQLALWDAAGGVVAERDGALDEAIAALRAGACVAVKGLGGFHLMVDAGNQQAVEQLRVNKQRPDKPFALMVPDVTSARRIACVSADEEALLCSPEAPIVLVHKRVSAPSAVADAVAPRHPLLGVMLPYTPLHYLLLHTFGRPLVATSGNRTDEPMCIDEREALTRLAGVATCFLVHNRRIARPVDDSIVRMAAGRPLLLRRARGYAPCPIPLGHSADTVTWSVGGHQKSTVAVAIGDHAVMSQHLGDLDTEPAMRAFEDAVRMLSGLYGAATERVACDLHPDYASTRYARRLAAPDHVLPVQHHHAHIVSCMVDNQLTEPVLGVAWDGSGYGPDGMIWGGEFMRATRGGYERIGALRSFPLAGGEQAVREPRRTALGLLYERHGRAAFDCECAAIRAFSDAELRIMETMLTKGIRTVRTTSIGRLFDAVQALLGGRAIASYEGQAAMELEQLAMQHDGRDKPYRIPFEGCADWGPLLDELVDDLRTGRAITSMAHAVHSALANLLVDIAHTVDEPRVVLSGGCFQNVVLLELCVTRLQQAGFHPYWHRHVPPNDGGLALGQLGVALSKEMEE